MNFPWEDGYLPLKLELEINRLPLYKYESVDFLIVPTGMPASNLSYAKVISIVLILNADFRKSAADYASD